MRSARMVSDELRSELIFLPSAGNATRVDDCVVIRTPDNPTYWWGNTLFFDAAPEANDFERWTRLFEEHIRKPQPASLHTTFGWSGAETGVVRPALQPFLDAGFELFATVVLEAEATTPIVAPHPNASARIEALAGGDWSMLRDLLVETRDERKHSLGGYTEFVERRIAGWRVLAERGQGAWFGAWSGVDGEARLIAALGVFVEAGPGADGRRIGRFQHVVTHPSARRQGLAGTLVEHASHHAFDVLAADTLLILADANDVARRVYESTGFRGRGWQHGLERGGYP